MKHLALLIALVGVAGILQAQKISDRLRDFDFSKVESGKELVATFGEPQEMRLEAEKESWIFEGGNQRLYVNIERGKVADYRFSMRDQDHFMKEGLGAVEVMEMKGKDIEEVAGILGMPMEISVRPDAERWTFRNEGQSVTLDLDMETRKVSGLRYSDRN